MLFYITQTRQISFFRLNAAVESVLLGSLSNHAVGIPANVPFDWSWQIYCEFNKTNAPCPCFSMVCVCNTWHILMRPSARSKQTVSGFLETWPVCETQTHSAWYSLPSSYPFLFCHLSTSPHCGNPSQVGTKWVSQGGSQLEHAGPCIRFLLDSAPAWAY